MKMLINLYRLIISDNSNSINKRIIDLKEGVLDYSITTIIKDTMDHMIKQ